MAREIVKDGDFTMVIKKLSGDHYDDDIILGG